MCEPGIYVGTFVDSHLHLFGDCLNQFLTASLFFESFDVVRQEDGMFRIEIELVRKSRSIMYGILLGDLREQFEQILRQCKLEA